MKTIWIAEDDPSLRWIMEKALSQDGWQVDCYDNPKPLLDDLAQQSTTDSLNTMPDVIISDINMPNGSGIDLLEALQQQFPDLPVIIITAYSNLDATVEAFKKGAFEFIAKPFDIEHLLAIATKAHEQMLNQRQQLKRVSTITANSKRFEEAQIIGDSPAIQKIYQLIGKLSRSDMSVLIYGESGTGKELIAKAIQASSKRKDGPFVTLNTAAIPAELLEAELFGHEKGAFTGASAQQKGYFEQANNGTLFLDEIGDMPLSLQTRLLRVLQDGQFYRVGGRQLIKTDVRIITASNKDLGEQVTHGLFREDLYHRLNVIKIDLPALRERHQDIEQLSHYFLKRAAQELEINCKTFSASALKVLNDYHWPGNIRQLENLCKRLSALVSSNIIDAHELGLTIDPHIISPLPDLRLSNNRLDDEPQQTGNDIPHWKLPLNDDIAHQLATNQVNLLQYYSDISESIIISQVYRFCDYNKRQTAKILGCGRNTLDRKLQQLQISDDHSSSQN